MDEYPLDDEHKVTHNTAKRKLPAGTEGSQNVATPTKKTKDHDSTVQPGWIDDEEEHQLLLSEGKNWSRPPLPKIDPKKDSITFQQLDCDYTTGETIKGMPGLQIGEVPIIRFFGVTEAGNSVQMNLHGVLPYFYIPVPNNFQPSDLNLFRQALIKRLEGQPEAAKVKETIVGIKIVEKNSIMYYSGPTKKHYLEITLATPRLVPPCRAILEHGFSYSSNSNDQQYVTFESNVPFVLRFMIDAGILGGNWLEVKAGNYIITKETNSTCQLEIDVAYNAFISHPAEGEWSKMAPFRILSFDIECAGRKGVFPESKVDPVIQIANLVTVQGETRPFIRNVFTFKPTSNIGGAQVLAFDNERKMLSEWQKFVKIVDPDIIIGYNIANFDFPYLVERARALNVESFGYLGRIKNRTLKIKNTTFSSKAYGKRETKETAILGRVQLDIIQIVQRDHKLRSYTLNSVSAHFLAEQKEEVHHSIITDLWNGTDHERRRLAVYCLKDAYLPQRLLDKLMIIYNYVEMARVTGVPISYLLSRGQQIKVVSQLYRKANSEGLIIPVYKTGGGDEESYSGATVLEPMRGYYKEPIATLDFSSLYPSIMMAHNLCYSTLIRAADLPKFDKTQVNETPTKNHFIKSDVKKGILPVILEELLAARKKAKDDLKNEKDPFKRAVLDGRQLALKISANSVYGFTGATVGKLPCIEVSASVTGYGREMIDFTKEEVEKIFSKKNGRESDATVIYGDTDSVMVNFHVKTVEEAMALGKEAAKLITTKFMRPISLEFEKVYYPYLLIARKRYAGLLWTNSQKYDKIDAKGIETVRRDNCPLVKVIISTCLHYILIEQNTDLAVQYTKSMISDLLQNKLDLSLLVITKALSKKQEEYTGKQAHVELAERMRKRDPHTAPNLGDRVPYVIIKATKGAKAWEKSEDPLYVLENNEPLDHQYYLDNQLKNPLIRIFEPILDKPQDLLLGAHTLSISVPTPKKGGIVGFAVKKETCFVCKTPLGGSEHTVCKQCKPREAEVYQTQLRNVSDLEKQFTRVWTQCQVCQGSLHQTVLCTSRDCPIFYMRTKVKKDLEDAEKMLERFELDW